MSSPALAEAAAATSNTNASLTLDSNPSRPAAAAARKRSVLLLEKRSPTTPAAVEDKMVVASASAAGNDLRHTIRGESVMPPPPRRKKPPPSAPRPKWQTVLSVAAKNAVLLAVLLYLGDLAWRWSHPATDEGAIAALAEAEYEGRIADVEASMKKAFRMLQVQLEAVDKKIGREVGSIKGELSALFEEKRFLLEDQLKRLDARTDDLDNALRGLKRMEFLRKDEFEKFWNEIKDSLNSDSRSDVDLDQVRALAREIAEREIEKHAADGLGRVDYAVASGGARVVRHSEAYGTGKGVSWLAASKSRSGVHSSAHKMLEPSFGEPGQCFALHGSSGFVEIRLRSGIIPEAVTLEHVSKDVAYDRSSAPKDCRVLGWFEAPEVDPSGSSANMHILTEFTYDLEKSNAQTFNIEAPEAGVINMIRLDFTSNHGSSTLTCIYRFRVHGHEPISPGSAALQA